LKLSSESGELNDALVKHVCYNQPLDIANIQEECGDLLWYIALILTYTGSTMEFCMQDNIDKLKLRYPEKFTEELAKERKDKVISPSVEALIKQAEHERERHFTDGEQY
jgi:NTP pyrophosphatase (non-canonical NTP hydrolase)